jgi:eukaryotic-like serine/threonine-protein kinase
MSSGSIVPGGQRASDAPLDPSPIGGRTSLGKYQILRELGAGGMGTVYLAIDSNLKRTVALKVLHKERASNETLVRRFESEATASAQLKHENIVTVYDAGQIDGYLFIALEFVDGTDIHELVARRGAIPLKRTVGYIKQVARALDHLHKRGIVHRDIKPSNLLLTQDGVVKLTDLGLARAVDDSLQSNITREGTTVGTVDYMSPEQARNSQAADIRSDIYSLGCTWFQMLTGEPPFPDGSVTNKLYAHISKPRPDPRALNQTVPDEIVAVMHKMMARKTDDRYQTPAELLHDLDNLGSGYKRLEEVLGDGEDSPPSPPSYSTPARGSPLPLPPRQTLRPPVNETDSGHRAGAETERSVPEHRLPSRQLPAPARQTPTPPRQLPAAARDLPTPPRQMPAAARDLPASSRHTTTPPRQAPDRELPADARPIATPPKGAPAARPAVREDSAPSRVGAVNRRSTTRRDGRISEEPVGTPRDPNRPVVEASLPAAWQPLAIQVGKILAGVAVIGLLGWFTAPYWLPSSSHGGTEVTRNPFDPSAPTPRAAQGATDDEPTKNADGRGSPKKQAGDGHKKSRSGKADKTVIVTEARKQTSGDKPGDSVVPGRPSERAEFPSWIDDLWEPHSATPARGPGTAALSSITVGRVGKDPAQVASLAEAIARLPAEGGLIELRGPGPFLLPSQRIQKRGQVIFSGVGPQSGDEARADAGESRPLIVIVPPPASPPGSKAVNGLVASETSLTFYGVDLVAFADEFRDRNSLRLVEVDSGDLVIQKCSVTLIGTRTAPTVAFTVSRPAAIPGAAKSAPTAPERTPHVLVDRTVIRGSQLAPLVADLPALDFLAVNSLFVTDQAPIFSLATGPPTPRGSDDSPAAQGDSRAARTVRFFSCTGCSEESAFVLRTNADSPEPPETRFLVLNSIFGVTTPTQSPMISLTNWPAQPEPTPRSSRFQHLSWKSQSLAARGWQDNLVSSTAGIRLEAREVQNWGRFWGDAQSSADYQAAPFPTIAEFSSVLPTQFKPETSLLHDTGEDTAPPGCDSGLLTVCGADIVRRADAYSHRSTTQAPEVDDEAAPPASVREINLDIPNRVTKDDLAKSINQTDWPSGTRFLVHGTKRRLCSPIRVVNRSFSIEFLDKELVLGFDERRADATGDREAFITVTGGSIEIINANIQIDPSSRPSTHRLLDVRGGNFAIRNSTLSGPRHDNPGFEELIRFSSSQDDSIAPADNEQFAGTIRNSFLSSVRNLLSGDLSARRLVIENSVLVAGGRIFDLRFPAGPGPSGLDLRSCTLSAGGEYFHFSARSTADALNRARVFAENTIFAPPARPLNDSASRAVLIGSASAEFVRERLDWWEHSSAYSNLIELPGSGAAAGNDSSGGSVDQFEVWRQLAGPAHIVRSTGQPSAVLLAGNGTTAKDATPSDFRLKAESLAATWSDTGKAIGAELKAQTFQRSKHTAAPKSPAPKTTAPKKSAPQGQGTTGGL